VSLIDHAARRLARPVPSAIAEVAARLAADEPGTRVVLFYGSNLRSGSLDGVLDFYLLTDRPRERGLWPRVGYRELALAGGQVARVKLAVVTQATFAAAAAGRLLDTTIWARFVQPVAIAWAADAQGRRDAVAAVAAAAETAGRLAAVLGPCTGTADDYWTALFRQTYAAELRVERPGREATILAHAPDHYRTLLPLAWQAAGIPFDAADGRLVPHPSPATRAAVRRGWAVRRRAGRFLNVARLVRAAFTFDGAARYGAWKVERHTGIAVRLTSWAERHPILAAPRVLWQVWHARSAERKAGRG